MFANVKRERERLVQAHQSKHIIGGSTSTESMERERERDVCVCVCVCVFNFVSLFFVYVFQSFVLIFAKKNLIVRDV